MTTRIRDVYVVNHRLDPHETELRVLVEVDGLTPATEIKGRLVGPRSMYSSTVEIAYPMREMSRDGEHVELRVVIPEASWWEPKTPFLYHGPVELWQDGQLCESVGINHGIRSLQVTAKGLRLNGRPYVLRGKAVQSSSTEAQARVLRAAGINALLTMPLDSNFGVCSLADRFGFLVLLCIEQLATLVNRGKEINNHPSCFACIAHPDWVDPTVLKLIHPMLMGVDHIADAVPAGAAFLMCKQDELVSLNEANVPKIVWSNRLPDPLPTRSDVIGWIESAS